MRKQPIVLALVVATLFAGCSGKATPPGPSGIDQAAQDLNVRATASTGVIRGVVVDGAIRPVANVLVALQAKGTTLSTNTSATGAFGFEGLPAGTYFLKTHKLGFQDTQSSADVVAGDSSPPVVKVQVVADLTTQPSVDLLVFKGFVECSVLAITPGATPSQVPFVGGGGGLFQPCYVPSFGVTPALYVGNENSIRTMNVTGNVTYLETDLVWTPTQAFGAQLYFNTCYNLKDYFASCVLNAGGDSPQTAGARGHTAFLFEKSQQIYFEVATNGTGNVLPASPAEYGNPGGFSLEQDFAAYFLVCHNFAPPEGYRFVKDGAPTVPA